MSMSGSHLTSALSADILTQLQSAFPVNASLLTAEKTAVTAAQTALATAIATGSGADIVTEVKAGVVTVTGVSSGGSTASGSVA